MHTDIQAIMDKIAKIQALAERGGTLHEAETAAAKMMELLLKHNLTLDDVTRHAQQANRSVKQQIESYGRERWRGDLLYMLAEFHMCKAIYSTWAKHVTVVGHEHNLIVVKEMYLWLMQEIDRLARIERDRLRAQPWPEHPGQAPTYVSYNQPGYQEYRDAHTAYYRQLRDYQEAFSAKNDAENRYPAFRNAFRHGAVAGIRTALHEARRTLKEQTTSEQWAIVPVLEKEVAQAYNEFFPNRGTTRQHGRSSSSGGYGAGRRAGAGINVGRQVGGSGRMALP